MNENGSLVPLIHCTLSVLSDGIADMYGERDTAVDGNRCVIDVYSSAPEVALRIDLVGFEY